MLQPISKPSRILEAELKPGEKITDVAVAVFERGGEFLLASRPEGKPYAHYWEFPGGKIEPNESVRDALVRELHEELNVHIDHATPWFSFLMRYTHATVRLRCWRVHAWRGEMRGLEGQQFAWQSLNALAAKALTVGTTLPGCVPIFASLLLPKTCLITCAAEVGVEAYLQYLRAFCGKNASNGAWNGEFADSSSIIPEVARLSVTSPDEPSQHTSSSCHPGEGRDPSSVEETRSPTHARPDRQLLIQLRDTTLPSDLRESFAREVIAIARDHGAQVVVNSDFTLAERTRADGVHLTSAQLRESQRRPEFDLVGASTHSREEIECAANLRCDYALLGAVKTTRTHPDATPMGWPRFAEQSRDTPIPLFALGGLSIADRADAIAAGAHGIAVMRGIMPLPLPFQ